MAKLGRPNKKCEYEGPKRNMNVSSIPVDLFDRFKMACLAQNTSMVDQVQALMQEYVGRASTKAAILKRAKAIIEQ